MSVPGGYSASSILQVSPDAMSAPIVAQSGGGDPPSLLPITTNAQQQPIVAQFGGAQKTIRVFDEDLMIRDASERRPGGAPVELLDSEKTALKKWGFTDEIIESDKALTNDFLDRLYDGDCMTDAGISLLTKCNPAQKVLTDLAKKLLDKVEKPLEIRGVRRSDGTTDVVAPEGPYSGATGTDAMFTTLPFSRTGPSQILFKCEGPTGTIACPPCEAPTGKSCIPIEDRKFVIFADLVNALIKDIEPNHTGLTLTDEQKKVYMPVSEGASIPSNKIEDNFKSLRDIKVGDLLVTYKIKKMYKFADAEVQKIYESQLNLFMNLLQKMIEFTKNLSSGNNNQPGGSTQENPLVINLTDKTKKQQVQQGLHILREETDEEYYRTALFEIMGTGLFKNGLVDTNANEFLQFLVSYIQRFKIRQQAEQVEQQAINYGFKAQEAERIRQRIEQFRKELANRSKRPTGASPSASARQLTPEEQREVQELEEQLEREEAETDKAIDALARGTIGFEAFKNSLFGQNPSVRSDKTTTTVQQQINLGPVPQEWKDKPNPLMGLQIPIPPELTVQYKTFIDLTNKATENTILLWLALIKDDLLKNPTKYDNKTYEQIIDSIITESGIAIDSTKLSQINDNNVDAFFNTLLAYVSKQFPPPPPTKNDIELRELLTNVTQPLTGIPEENEGNNIEQGGITENGLGSTEGIKDLVKSSALGTDAFSNRKPLVLNTSDDKREVLNTSQAGPSQAGPSQQIASLGQQVTNANGLSSTRGIAQNISKLPKGTGIFESQEPLTLVNNLREQSSSVSSDQQPAEQSLSSAVNPNPPPVLDSSKETNYYIQGGAVYKVTKRDSQLRGYKVYPSFDKTEIDLDSSAQALPEIPSSIDEINIFLETTMKLINPSFTLLAEEYIRKPGTYSKSLGINITKPVSGNEAITRASILQKNKNEIAIAGGSIVDEFRDKINDPHPNISIVNTIGDGTCLVHSFLLSISSSYRKMSEDFKRIIGQVFRVTVLVSKTNDETIIARLENLNEYLTDVDLTKIAKSFKINIVVFVKVGPVKSIEIHKNAEIKQFILMYNNGVTHYSAVAEEVREGIYKFIFNNVDFIKPGENVFTLSYNLGGIKENKRSENVATALLTKGGSRRRKTRKIAYRDTPSYILKKRLKTTKKAKRRTLSHK